jgi:phosphatidylinositol glycan class U
VVVSDQPLLAIAVTCGIISAFKSYPTLGDASLWLGLLGCFPEIWPGECCHSPVYDQENCCLTEAILLLADLRHPLLSVSLQLYSTILLPILHSLWLESGTGNANFFYAATLVHGLGCGMAIVDMLGAGLRHEVARKVIEMGLLDETLAQPTRSGDSANLKSARGILEDHDLVVVQYAGLGS